MYRVVLRLIWISFGFVLLEKWCYLWDDLVYFLNSYREKLKIRVIDPFIKRNTRRKCFQSHRKCDDERENIGLPSWDLPVLFASRRVASRWTIERAKQRNARCFRVPISTAQTHRCPGLITSHPANWASLFQLSFLWNRYPSETSTNFKINSQVDI